MKYYIKAKVKFNREIRRLTHAGHEGTIHVYPDIPSATEARVSFVARLGALGYYDIDSQIVLIQVEPR